MEPIILQHHGFIDKYIGDAIMALFPRHADDAVQTGIDILHALVDYNQERQKNGSQAIQIGIGINTGSLILGTVGGTNRMDGTVISDAVNLAARIEGLTKTFSTPLLITNHTVARLTNPQQYAMRVVGQVRVKGKTVPVTVYEVFEADPQLVREQKLATASCFAEAVILYEEQRWDAAAQLFQICLDQNPLDQVARIYRDRCQFEPTKPVVLSDEINF
jgi:class 3 adenylate cyclase